MERWQNKIAVVTGASSGIGAAIVKDLIEAGLIVVGLARRLDLLEQLSSQLSAEHQKKYHVFRCDVSQLESVNAAFDWIEENLGGIDILVNNAACYSSGQLSTMDVNKVREDLQINVMGVVYCTQRAFKSMKNRNFDGHVVLINSVLGHNITVGATKKGPLLGVYPATKYAMTAMNEIYRLEFSGSNTNVKVTSISPGIVDTDIIPGKVRRHMKDRMLSSEDVSKTVLYAISTPPHVLIHEMIVKPLFCYSKL